jgi:iron complex outermembrane receptor protein
MLDYAGIAPLRDRFHNIQTLLNWDARRDMARLPAGPLELAWGFEWREEQAQDRPDLLTQSAATTGAARAATQGGYRSREAYAEFGLPLWRSQTTPRELLSEIGLRVLDTSLYAPRAVFDAGLRLQLASGLVTRAGYAQSYRSPTVGELFAGINQTNPAVNDPCADFSSLGTEQQQRCIDQGVAADGSFSDNGNEVPLLSGGSTQLRPETAQTWRLSLDWSPTEHSQLRLAAFAIDIDNAIASLSADSVLRQCIINADPRSCTRIARDDQGRLLQINSPLSNIAQDRVQGLDVEAQWTVRLVAWELAHRLLLSHIMERQVRTQPGAPALASAGEYSQDLGAIPRWSGLYTLRAESGPWRWLYSLQYIHGLQERGGDLFTGTSRDISSRSYHDLSLSWTHPQGWRLNAVIGNLTDRQPPLVINADDANTDVATYRLLGRRYTLNLTIPFGPAGAP